MTETDSGRVITATFNTLGGANKAVARLQEAEDRGLIDVENAAAITKNAWGDVSFRETEDLAGWQGIGRGALIGGLMGMLFPASVPSAAARTAAVAGLGARMHDAGFEDDEIRAMAEGMEPGTSMLVAVVEPQMADDVMRFLNDAATKVGWATLTAAAANVLEERGKTGEASG
jgi:uncharacterized membrane protein